MKVLAAISAFLVSFLLFGACSATSTVTGTGKVTDTGCPPGYTRVEDEGTGTYDCASRRDMEDIGDVLDGHRQ